MGEDNKKTKNVSDIIAAIISIFVIVAIFLFGIIYIKNAADSIGMKDEGYRNLSEVNIYSGSKYGRGIVIFANDEYIDIVTAKHLVSDENNVTVEFGNKGRVEAEVIYYYGITDAAIIRIDREISDHDLKGAKAPDVMSKDEYDSISLSKTMYFASDIYDTSKKYEEGKWIQSHEEVSELGGDVGLFIGEVAPGMSGEGLYNEDDVLVGMIVGANDTAGAVIPSYVIINEYVQWVILSEE